MSAHIPGPWRSESHGAIMANVDGRRRQVALAVGDPDPMAEPNKSVEENASNARLIAASPDLLAACEVALSELRDLYDDHPVKKQIRAAIEKATTT